MESEKAAMPCRPKGMTLRPVGMIILGIIPWSSLARGFVIINNQYKIIKIIEASIITFV